MLALALTAWLSVDDPGFGGVADEPAPPEGECVIRDDDGVWRSCAAVIEAKKKKDAPVEEAPPAVDPEQEKLREAFNKTPEPPKKTKLELEYEKANLDVTLPLLELRIVVARLEEELKELTNRGAPPSRTEPVQKRYEQERDALDLVEAIALTRLVDCSKRIGKPLRFKNYKMTPGGPVYLSHAELMAQLPSTDPFGCGRNEMIDRGTVERARRLSELRAILATTNFGYHDVGKRKELERELKELEDDLGSQTLPGLVQKRK